MKTIKIYSNSYMPSEIYKTFNLRYSRYLLSTHMNMHKQTNKTVPQEKWGLPWWSDC